MIVFGIHPVEEVLRREPSAIQELLFTGDHLPDTIQSLLGDTSLRPRRVPTEDLDQLTDDGNHQRVAARLTHFPYAHFDDLLSLTEDNPRALILALSQVQDPGNLGAILRSAAALGVDAVLLPKHRAASVTPAVIRASAGMAFHLPIAEVTNLSRSLKALQDSGFWIVGTLVDDAQPAWELDWDMKAVLVMGGEHRGIRPGVAQHCDFPITIPLSPAVDSLNVSAAAAVVLYDRLRTLRNTP